MPCVVLPYFLPGGLSILFYGCLHNRIHCIHSFITCVCVCVCVCLVQSRRKSTKKQKDQTNKPKTPTQNNPAVAAHQLQYLCVANEGAHRRASDFPSYFILMSSRTPPPHAAPAHAEKQRQHTSLCYMSRGGWPPFRPPTHFVQHSSGGGPPETRGGPSPPLSQA